MSAAVRAIRIVLEDGRVFEQNDATAVAIGKHLFLAELLRERVRRRAERAYEKARAAEREVKGSAHADAL